MVYKSREQFLTDKWLKQEGFCGFVSLRSLQASGYSNIPKGPGVYLVLNVDGHDSSFLKKNIGRHSFKKPTVAVSVLREKWVDGATVLYVGKAGGTGLKSTLRSRIRQLVAFGIASSNAHWGGRYLWQLENAFDLQICWKVCTEGESSDKEESEWLFQFYRKHHKIPFANIRKIKSTQKLYFDRVGQRFVWTLSSGFNISQCANCRNKLPNGAFCAAFPQKIPDQILLNHADHRNPFPGDNGIRFIPRVPMTPEAESCLFGRME